MTIYPRGIAFLALTILVLLAIDWLGIDWRIGLLAVSLDALITFAPWFAGRPSHHNGAS